MLPDQEIHAVISLPRLVYTDHMFSAIETLGPLNINVDRGSGVFWGQVLTRTIEGQLNKDDEKVPRYILTLDYDTVFYPEHVLKLYELLETNPEYDCLIPLQTKRASTEPMFAMDYSKKVMEVPVEFFQRDISPIEGGHFGLTMFRTESFKKIEKPWFLPIPDPTGSWGDGRVDEDIYFWKNYSKTCKVGLANDVPIGHMQMYCTWSGKADRGWKPVHVNVHDVVHHNTPEWAIPEVSDDFIQAIRRKTGGEGKRVREVKKRRRTPRK